MFDVKNLPVPILRQALVVTSLYAWQRHTKYIVKPTSLSEWLYYSRFPTMEIVLKMFDGILSSMIGRQVEAKMEENNTGKYLDSWFAYYRNQESIRTSLINRGWIPSNVTSLTNVNLIVEEIMKQNTEPYTLSLANTILKNHGIGSNILGPLLWLWVHALAIPSSFSNSNYCSMISALYIYQLCPACKTHMTQNYIRFLDAICQIENGVASRYMISSILHTHITRAIKEPLPSNAKEPRLIDSEEVNQIHRKLVLVWNGKI